MMPDEIEVGQVSTFKTEVGDKRAQYPVTKGGIEQAYSTAYQKSPHFQVGETKANCGKAFAVEVEVNPYYAKHHKRKGIHRQVPEMREQHNECNEGNINPNPYLFIKRHSLNFTAPGNLPSPD